MEIEENEIRYKIITNRSYWEAGTKEQNIVSAILELQQKINFIQSQSKRIKQLEKDLKMITKFRDSYLFHWQNSKEQNTELKQENEKVKEHVLKLENVIISLTN